MSKTRISVFKRSTAIIEEEYNLDIDTKKYDEFMKENPDASEEDAVNTLECEKVNYEVSVDDINMVHETCYELLGNSET
jgi:hypothetical protein